MKKNNKYGDTDKYAKSNVYQKNFIENMKNTNIAIRITPLMHNYYFICSFS